MLQVQTAVFEKVPVKEEGIMQRLGELISLLIIADKTNVDFLCSS